MSSKKIRMKNRFDGYLPVVVDVETAGVNALTDALLEVAAIATTIDDEGQCVPTESFSTHVTPFEGANINPKSLEINKIQIDHPFRFAIAEDEALKLLFEYVDAAVKKNECRRAVLVGHNAHFDLDFLQAAMRRCKITKSPFHAFTCFDTATLSGLVYGKTVLAKALKAAGIKFNKDEAHSALYDTEKTAELFCYIVNKTPLPS